MHFFNFFEFALGVFLVLGMGMLKNKKFICISLLLSVVLADSKEEEYMLLEKHETKPARANFECFELLGNFTVSIFTVSDQKAKLDIKTKSILEGQTRVTSINVKFEPRKFSAEYAAKLGEEVKTVVKDFEVRLPLAETRFLKKNEIRIGDVGCLIYIDKVKVCVTYREDDIEKCVYYTFDKDGKFSSSEKF